MGEYKSYLTFEKKKIANRMYLIYENIFMK